MPGDSYKWKIPLLALFLLVVNIIIAYVFYLQGHKTTAVPFESGLLVIIMETLVEFMLIRALSS